MKIQMLFKMVLNYFCSSKCAMLEDPLKLVELTREVNMSKDGVTALGQVVFSLSRLLLSLLHQFPFTPLPLVTIFTLKGTPQGSCITVVGFTGVNWVSLGLLEDRGRCQPSPAKRSWRAGPLTLNWGLELPAAGWMWPCKAQDAFSTWNSQAKPLESLRYGAWKAGRMGGVDAGLRLEGSSRNLQ